MWRRFRVSLVGGIGPGAVLIAVLLAVFMPIGHAYAQSDSSLNLTTSPLPVALNAKPGQTVSTDLRVKNGGTKDETLQVQLLKFAANNDEGQPRIADRGPNDDYFDWVSFSQDKFIAEPNVWKTITMTIKVPNDAGLGYYYAVVFSRAAKPGQTDRGASIAGGAATLVLLDVKSPNAKRQLEITSFTSKKRIYEFLPAEFTVRLHNNGNVFLSPSGSVFISHGDKQMAVLDVNPGHGNILPQTSRNYKVLWADGFPHYKIKESNGAVVTDKKGNNQYTLDWNLQDASKLRIGKYTANVIVIYDDGQRDIPVQASLTFWIIPWRILGVFLVILIIIGIGIFTVVRKLWRSVRKVKPKKHKEKDAGKTS